MKTFTDTAGRTWTISLTLGTAMAVKARLGVDLLQPEAGDPPLLTRLGTDEMLLGEVLCCLLERQFETHKVSEDDVRAAFDGQTLLAAQQAFYEELIDFFRSRGRKDRAKAVAKQMAMIEAAVTAIEARIDGLDVDTVVGEAMSEPSAKTDLLRRSKAKTDPSRRSNAKTDMSRRSNAKTDMSRRSNAKTDGAMSGSSPEPSESTPGR